MIISLNDDDATDIKLTYTTKTKTQNGLKKELIKKFKESFNIASTTRIYNLDDYKQYRGNPIMTFEVENAFNGRFTGGRGSINYEINNESPEKVINVVFGFSPQYVSR